MYRYLDKIKCPNDVKKLNSTEILALSGEIREFLIDNVSKTGGHLASNLGVVEVTLSLFKVFNLEKDKIVWDVGHQSYVHKILTGRKDKFETLRKYGGISGFPKRCESKYDSFDTGHSSTSISAALGMARARDILKKDNHVIAVIGDGALTGGMAFEALNDVGYSKTNLIIILNDNQMSISDNVGGLSTYLSKVRLDPGYNRLKNEINNTLNQTTVGKNIATSISKIKDSIKQLVVPSMLFEDMGLKYLGPIDGHNIDEISDMLYKAKKSDGPVIIHTITQKGKGYNFAEENPNKFHSIAPFDSCSGKLCPSNTRTYSNAFGESLIDIAKEIDEVVAVTAAMPDGTGLKKFAKEFPHRFFDVGIAEQHATTLAAGMAKEGLKPVFAVYSTFLQRAYDQVLHDVCVQNLPVVFAIDRAGIVGEDGETHQGVFDISYLSHIPNLNIVAPKCLEEVKPILRWALTQNEPVAIRYPRGGDLPGIELNAIEKVEKGKWDLIRKGKDVVIIATGKMVQHSEAAIKLLGEEYNVGLINATFIKPLDKNLLDDIAKDYKYIITIEDNVISGGLGREILSYFNSIEYKGKIVNLGYEDKFIQHGDLSTLYKLNKLDITSIRNEIVSILK
ncbi:1-deoxy-D-xylulose-5-phosphate synthase [Clostridium folliculivorans]|uniref:1-deoxy-D-xylulose-5-phosphate synthase n=1 Tax=Clostridium folliculivorans TaxID=2886038 RepID=A0A9W6D9P8_9CLOT|nr:1-deoxy-D-xylulose-5-phosphate synthase [Clostridium folliculivorans]GKU24002.1 1-deoxy-D-xylulose-5-phosphate synthase [Clostridium folliculivorans]GKU30117.1 1-deoxy-D-xylulose-5-phosphate synthase [Clostridium folliculivorans]